MKLHLGCGKKYIKGFYHVDLLDYPHVDCKTSLDDLFFAEDESVELIYASHVLEHFGRHEYKKVLEEWCRVLKPGGVLRVAVPDFSAVARYHIEQDDNMDLILGLLMGGQKSGEYDYHKMAFSEQSLTRGLLNSGFTKVFQYDWRNTEHAHVDDFSQAYLPHMDKNNGFLMSLNLEAVK